jgi:hypothetical protein
MISFLRAATKQKDDEKLASTFKNYFFNTDPSLSEDASAICIYLQRVCFDMKV